MMSNIGLSISASESRFLGLEQSVIPLNLTDMLTSYSQEKKANGGYWSASLELTMPRGMAEDWFYNGVGREITTRNQSGAIVWQGFVNEVSITTGYTTNKAGPLMAVTNDVAVTYQTRRYNTNPPIGGIQYTSGYVQNTESIAKYGIWRTILNAGTGSGEEATQARDTYLAEWAWPETSKEFSFSVGDTFSVALLCIGYAQYLTVPMYVNAEFGVQDTSEKVAAVIAEDPNNLFTARLLTSMGVDVYKASDKVPLWDVIKACVVVGDSDFNRVLFYVEDDCQYTFDKIPTEPRYKMDMNDGSVSIKEINTDTIVYPWDVVPGTWLDTGDFATASTHGVNRQLITRMFIESVTYNAPWDLSLGGGKNSRAEQQLARLGVGGTF